MPYKAFLSYSHAADRKLAPALQQALQSFAKPFYRLRALKVFRDATDLQVTPELWPLIQKSLRESEFFILLASPDASRSEWVGREIEEWLAQHSGDLSHLIVVATEGVIEWDARTGDFDWTRTTALPRLLERRFHHEPLYVDLRGVRSASDLSLRNPEFLDAVATLAATLYDRPKDDMIGAEIRSHRIFKTAAVTVLTILVALLVATASASVRAREQQRRAERETYRARANEHRANQQRESANRARAAAKKAEAAANEQRDRAEKNRLLADQQRDVAFDALTTLIFDAQAQLRQVPESRAVRKHLLRMAAEKLDDVDTTSANVSLKVRRNKAVALTSLGDNARDLGDFAEALRLYRQGWDSYSALLSEYPKEIHLRESMWLTSSKLADAAAAEQKYELSEHHYRRALAIIEQLSREQPHRQDLLRFLAISCGKMGDVHMGHADFVDGRLVLTGLQEARRHWLRALQIYERLRPSHPDDAFAVGRGRWQARNKLAEIHLELGDAAVAKQYVLAAYDLIRDYTPDTLSPVEGPDVATSLEAMAALSAREGDLAAARSYGERAVEVRYSVAMHDRENFMAAVALALSFFQLGEMDEAAKQYERALTLYEKAADTLRRLRIDDREHYRPDLQMRLDLMEERADACRKVMQVGQSSPTQ